MNQKKLEDAFSRYFEATKVLQDLCRVATDAGIVFAYVISSGKPIEELFNEDLW